MEGDEVNMKLEGTMVDLFTKLYTKLYRKHAQIDKAKVVVYMQIKKVLYDNLQVSHLF